MGWWQFPTPSHQPTAPAGLQGFTLGWAHGLRLTALEGLYPSHSLSNPSRPTPTEQLCTAFTNRLNLEPVAFPPIPSTLQLSHCHRSIVASREYRMILTTPIGSEVY